MIGRLGLVLLCLISAAHAAEPLLVDRILLFGNVRTRSGVVMRELAMKTGMPYSDGLLTADKARLKRLELFRSVEMTAVPDSARGLCSLLLLLKEQSPWTLDPLLVYDGLFGWTAGFGVIHKNVMGRRQTLTAGVKVGGVRQIRAAWSDPWLGGSLRLFAEMHASRTQFRYLYEDYNRHFLMTDDEFGFSAGRNIGRADQIGVSLNAEQVRTDDPTVTFSGTGLDGLLTLDCFVRHDGRDRPEYPLSGWYGEAGKQWSGPVSGFRFGFTHFDFRGYIPMPAHSCVALQVQSQISEGPVPVYKRIHVGGSKTLRGYATSSIAGDNFWMTSAEVRFPMILESQVLGTDRAGYFGVLFCDAAGVWFSKDEPDIAPNYFCSGFGFHLLWDSVVLRTEVGFRTRGGWFLSSSTGVKF